MALVTRFWIICCNRTLSPQTGRGVSALTWSSTPFLSASLRQAVQTAAASSDVYKRQVLLAAKPEDVRIIHSPVGMPGRALATPLVQKLEQGLRFPPKHCARCLKACEPAKVPYCITHALIEAVKGNVEEGLFFCGANVGRLDRMRSVRELMDELMDDWRKHQ